MAANTLPSGAIRVAGDTYVVPGLTASGFIDGLVIDTPEDAGPFAAVPVDRVAITHGHADHFSVAHVLRDTGAVVSAARDDASLVENPDINIRGMFSWAKPTEHLVTKLFKGTPCRVDEYLEEWDDPRATPVALPGHTLGHHGFITCDGVLFSGDALYLSDLWDRHPLPYAIDPGMVSASLKRIGELDVEWVVPGHGRPVPAEEAVGHIDHHLRQIQAVEDLLLDRLVEAHTTEQAVALVSAERGLTDNPASYWLAVTTVKGYLGELANRGDLEFFVREHAGWWRTTR